MVSLRNIVLALTMTSTVVQAQEVLKVYNWTDYIDPEVISDFERTAGVKVEYEVFTSSNEMLESLDRGDRYDVIVPTSDSVLRKLLNDHRLQPIHIDELKNFSSVNPVLQIRLSAIEQAHRYVVPYAWGAVGLFVNTELAEPLYGGALPNSWSVLFDPNKSERLANCGVALLPTQEEVFSIWMQYKGHSLGKSGPRRISKAAALIRNPGVGIAPTDFSAYIDMMRNGRVCAGMAWGGMVSAANKNDKLRFSIPEEGSLLFIDSLAIPANAPNPRLAQRFIDFMLAPENAARNAVATDFSPPAKEEQGRLHFLESLTDKQRAAVITGWADYVAKP